MYRMRRPADFLPLFVDKPMKFPPGNRFDYNDAGFILLGLVIEAASGLTFTEYVEANVLARAGMADSGYFAADQLPARTARAYLQNPDGTWRTNVFEVPAIGSADGGAYATAPDLARLWHTLMGHRQAGQRLLSEAMTGTLLRPQVVTDLPAPYGGYGLGVWLDDGLPFVEGGDPGVGMISRYFPESELSLTLLANVETRLWPTCPALTPLIHPR
jgi:CubicO group peptidase (beta-lactamase class C family)